MATQTRTDDTQIEAEKIVSNTQALELSPADRAQVEETFREAKDFRDL